MRITVRQGTIESITLVETGGPVDTRFWYTIDQVFQLIPGFAEYDGVKDVDVEYDGTLWYPASVRVRFGDDVLEGGSHYTMTAVGPAP